MLLDKRSDGESWRVLHYLQWSIKNAVDDETKLDSKAQFAEIDIDGNTRQVSATALHQYDIAPLPSAYQENALNEQITRHADRLVRTAHSFAASLANEHLNTVSEHEMKRLEQEERQVRASLEAEIAYESHLIDRYSDAANPGLQAQAERRKEDIKAVLSVACKRSRASETFPYREFSLGASPPSYPQPCLRAWNPRGGDPGHDGLCAGALSVPRRRLAVGMLVGTGDLQRRAMIASRPGTD